MKRVITILGISIVLIGSFCLIAADHIDAPAIQGTTTDITDFYAFQVEDTNTIAFVVNTQGLFSPTASANASYDENTLIEINIDTSGDNVEDLVIQAIPRDGKMYFFGPIAPSATGLNSVIETSATTSSVDITAYGSNAITTTNSGMKFFAGPRDDPFFMDFAQYGEIITGNATTFNDPGTDTFAGSNVLSIVVEVPKSQIGGSGTINVWAEAKGKQ
jgi:hypothetical protein